ncbi:unnamed protein product [Rotaria sp. Silwood1]|nr:unnamed protein product [Rotaria sp. Silwood1]
MSDDRRLRHHDPEYSTQKGTRDFPGRPRLPRILGHEGIGEIVELGSNVRDHLKKGDIIGVQWIHKTCLHCEYCLTGRETLCKQQQNSGFSMDGCFAEYVLMDADFAVKLPDGMDPYTSAPLYCAGVTTYKALKVSKVRAGEWVSIVGVGGLVYDGPSDQHGKWVRQKVGGVQATIVAVPLIQAYEEAFKSVKRGGRIVGIGLPAGKMSISAIDCILRGIQLIGSTVGTRKDLQEALELAKLRNLSRRFSFDDYRYSAPGQFLLLSSLCKLRQKKLLSENLLIEEIEIILNRLQLTASKSFINLFNLIREIIGLNMIMSGLMTNWEYVPQSAFSPYLQAYTVPVSYGECNCGLSFKCTQSSGGMMSGCYPLKSILQRKLYRFYDQNCIDSNGNFTRLNMSTLEKSQFNLNSTIESILNNLMIEEYKSNLSYENYFSQCQPLSCSYSYIKTHDVTQTIIFLISLYGGLVLITRCLAIIFAKLYEHKKNRIKPEALQQNI